MTPIKLMAGNRFYIAQYREDDKYFYFETPYALKDELKLMKGSKWMGYDKEKPEKVWRVDKCRQNMFNIDYLRGLNPKAPYKTPLAGVEIRKTRKDWNGKEITIYEHQLEMTLHILVRKQCIISGEMGVGKTLSAFEAIELSLVPETWYVAPKSALASVKLEAQKWMLRSKVRYLTYDELKKVLETWTPGALPPKFIVYDESSRIKNATAQRSQAAFYLAEQMRNCYGRDCYIVLMSGSPAPKSPADWYNQVNTACPGYLREGDIYKFQQRYAVVERQGDMTGVSYNKILTWRDGNATICNTCGRDKTHTIHTEVTYKDFHTFVPLFNEVKELYNRMGGLVLVKFKKDCLDLPDKIYRIIKLKPTLDLLRAAKIVSASCKSAIQTLTMLRELSDGFQYRDVNTAKELCDKCMGQKTIYLDNNDIAPCDLCNATGSKNKVEREVIEVDSPKLEALTDLLEEVEETGRIVIYAGFTASIDRISKHLTKLGWNFIRVDGRGWYNTINPNWDTTECLKNFQNGDKNNKSLEKLAFVGHPGSAGMGLTLTASSMIVYLSNDFNAESRIQSEDRIHRAGMDVNRGATIVDMVLLPTDQKVLDNLKKKKELQSLSLGELKQAIDDYQFTTS